MGLYHTNHVTRDVFKFFFISELKFSHVYFHPVISNCASFHHGHAMYPLSLCLSHKSYRAAQLISILVQPNTKSKNSLLKGSYFGLHGKDWRNLDISDLQLAMQSFQLCKNKQSNDVGSLKSSVYRGRNKNITQKSHILERLYLNLCPPPYTRVWCIVHTPPLFQRSSVLGENACKLGLDAAPHGG